MDGRWFECGASLTPAKISQTSLDLMLAPWLQYDVAAAELSTIIMSLIASEGSRVL